MSNKDFSSKDPPNFFQKIPTEKMTKQMGKQFLFYYKNRDKNKKSRFINIKLFWYVI